MANDLKTPGVYVREITKFPPSVPQVATAVPVFIGYTANPVTGPKRITSMVEFETIFGGPYTKGVKITITDPVNPLTASSYSITAPELRYRLYYAMQMFFANGGSTCYVLSFGQYSSGSLSFPYTNTIKDKLALLELEDEPTIIVPVEAGSMTSGSAYNYMTDCLKMCNTLQDRFAILDIVGSVSDFRNNIGVNYLKYGAAYYPDLNTILSFPDSAVYIEHEDDATTPVALALNGNTLAHWKEIAASEVTPFAVSNALLKHETKIRELVASKTIVLPPSSAMAGIYASVDRDRGVWKAPANVSLNAVTGPSVKIDDEDQGDLNIDQTGGKSINAIRSFVGKGTMVWGARTLAGNDNEWRYVSVRRLFITVEESIRKATAWAVFEPNDANTWIRIKAQIENYLTNLWKDGALAGATAEEAFYVAVGLGSTMSSDDILNGRMNIEIGMAAVRPAEFIVLKFSHKLQTS